jgi:aminomethyltransferase
METDSIRSPFYEAAAAIGASFMEEGGWYWTEGFGDADAEYRGVRDDLGVWDVSPLNKWEFGGPDALAAAQRVHTSNVLGLEVGQVHYGALCDADGLMVDDGTVYRLPDRVWVMTNGSRTTPSTSPRPPKASTSTIEAITPTMPHLGLQGPRARQALGPVVRRRYRQPAVLPLPARAHQGRGGAVCGVADGLRRRTRLRTVLSSRSTPPTCGTWSCPR